MSGKTRRRVVVLSSIFAIVCVAAGVLVNPARALDCHVCLDLKHACVCAAGCYSSEQCPSNPPGECPAGEHCEQVFQDCTRDCSLGPIGQPQRADQRGHGVGGDLDLGPVIPTQGVAHENTAAVCPEGNGSGSSLKPIVP